MLPFILFWDTPTPNDSPPGGQLLVRAECVQVRRRKEQFLVGPAQDEEPLAEELPHRIRLPHLLPERSAAGRSRIQREAEALRGSGAARRNDLVDDPRTKEGGETIAGAPERRTVAPTNTDHGAEEGPAAGGEWIAGCSAAGQFGSVEITKED